MKSTNREDLQGTTRNFSIIFMTPTNPVEATSTHSFIDFVTYPL